MSHRRSFTYYRHMHVLLFDQHAGGHHAEYASKLLDRLKVQSTDLEVEFLTTKPSPEHEQYFENDISCLSTTDETLSRAEIVDLLDTYVEDHAYDIVHVLQIDDILLELATRFRPDSSVQVCGTLNGAYFHFWNRHFLSYINDGAAEVAARVDGGRFVQALTPVVGTFPELGPKLCPPAVALAASLNKPLDHLFVHAETAMEYVDRVSDGTPTTVIPDPLEVWEADDVDRARLRSELDIPTDGLMFLFFGETRYEKGPDVLLEAVKQYHGPPCTIVFAGPPDHVTAGDLERAEVPSNVNLHERLEFVPEADVRSYFLAADAVVLPYRREFGVYRTSGVFQKACAAGRPLIVSDFGELKRRVREYDLGTTFPLGDADALAGTLGQTSNYGYSSYNPRSASDYADSQSYTQAAVRTLDIYRKLV
ncbi:glycosyltransferase [Halomicrobium mukohataei]|uniref:Glycosyltransferase n=2 Tax=Halomicrobium mukohataei TaxID=57705 RepID=A0A847U6Y3_9EURY|nr:glycosyltransferase [Halomicrobium mukohataei]